MRAGSRTRVVAVGLALCGCSTAPAPERPWTPDTPDDRGAIVAKVGDTPIFAAEVAAVAKERGKTPREALNDLLGFHLLAERARESGVRPPADLSGERRALVQRFLERRFEPTTRPEDMPDEVLLRIYNGVRKRYVHSRMVQVAVLVIYTGPLMKKEAAARRAAAAKDLYAELSRRAALTPEDMEAMADEPRGRERKLVFQKVWQDDEGPFRPDVGREMLKLKKRGERTNLLTDSYGFYVALYLDEKPPLNRPFAEVREELRAEAYAPWRQRAFLDLTDGLIKKYRAEQYPERLAAALEAAAAGAARPAP